MKGFIDKDGYDRPPCGTCKHKNKMTVEEPCYSCISILDLALHKPNSETEFAKYEKMDEQRKGGEVGMKKQPTQTNEKNNALDVR